MSELSSLKMAHCPFSNQMPIGGIALTRQGQGEMPPGVRFGVTKSKAFWWPLVAPLSMNVESPDSESGTGRHKKCEVTVTVSDAAAGIAAGPVRWPDPGRAPPGAAAADAPNIVAAIAATEPAASVTITRRPRDEVRHLPITCSYRS